MARTPRAPRLVRKEPSTGLLVLEERTLKALRSIQGPVAVVGICGGARKGKSSLLTRIMECQGGLAQSFQASAEVDPCTKGLHISTVPLPARDENGRPYSLLFLDTEGIDATDQDRKDMCQVFALCVLLSSVVLLNEVGTIAESTLDMLSLVCDITGIVRARSAQGTQQGTPISGGTTGVGPPTGATPGDAPSGGSSSEGGGSTAAGSPSSGDSSGIPEEDQDAQAALAALSSVSRVLCWVLRDFSLRLGEDTGPTEYMEQALQDVPEEGRRGAAAAEKNRVRRGIRALFPARRCFTLVRPTSDEESLQGAHDLCLEDFRPEFQVGVKRLAAAACGAAVPPAVRGVPLTGPYLASLCEAYIAAMNGGAVPAVTGWQVFPTQEAHACAQAVDAALRLYESHLGEPIWEKAHSLDELHGRGARAALESFSIDTRGVPEGAMAVAEGRLLRRLNQKLDAFSVEVAALAVEHAQDAEANQGAIQGAIQGVNQGENQGADQGENQGAHQDGNEGGNQGENQGADQVANQGENQGGAPGAGQGERQGPRQGARQQGNVVMDHAMVGVRVGAKAGALTGGAGCAIAAVTVALTPGGTAFVLTIPAMAFCGVVYGGAIGLAVGLLKLMGRKAQDMLRQA